MALKSAKDIDFKKQVISIRIQELSKDSLNGRPYEEDLTENGLCADSIGDIPLVGDFISLKVTEMKKSESGVPEFDEKIKVFKVLTRYLSLDQMISNNYPMFCNLVVEPVTDMTLIGKLNKD